MKLWQSVSCESVFVQMDTLRAITLKSTSQGRSFRSMNRQMPLMRQRGSGNAILIPVTPISRRFDQGMPAYLMVQSQMMNETLTAAL